MTAWLLLNSSQLLGFLCVAGVTASLARWQRAPRRDFLLAFILFLLGTAVHQVNVHLNGAGVPWPLPALAWSAAGRVMQIAGGILFVRAAMRERCGEWGWILVFAACAIGAGLL